MKFNFSLVILGALGLSQVSAGLPYCEMKDMKYRKNLKDLTPNEFSNYVKAVKKLNSGYRLTTWDKFVKIHVDNYDLVHSSKAAVMPLFLVWHRLYLYYVEKELQKIDPSVTIPYWDWTAYPDQPQKDIAFSDKFFGGMSKDDSKCVKDGQFKDFKVGVTSEGTGKEFCLRRRNGWAFDQPFYSFGPIDSEYLEARDFYTFQDIEFLPHGIVHNNVGEEFERHASPGDPLFYSHHAFLDLLWFTWQNRKLSEATSYEPLSLSDQIVPWNVTIREVIDPFDRLCVAYKEDKYSFSGPKESVTRSGSVDLKAVKAKVEPYNPPKTSDAKLLKEYDEKYYKGGLVTLEAPSMRSASDFIKFPKPLSEEFIKKMGYPRAKIRQLERKDALIIDALNQAQMF